ncbi:MAG: alpha-glucan family phosphorylase [Lentisphaeria bacterium]|nr:alpha-glucan family phosphorylase [Lentisphaeria bacterium]
MKLFNVAPHVPEELKFLEELSYNMWWCWHPLAIELFVRIDPNLWQEVEGNSRRFLCAVSQERLEELAGDAAYLRQLNAVKAEFDRAVPVDQDFSKRTVAYFSMEFGIHESIRIFSGGLGILSGDHLKAASDLQLPLAAVGLLYRQGYFRQVLDRHGWQLERYPENEIHNMPLVRARDAEGKSITIQVPLIDRTLHAAVWILWVGSIPLVLLDTEIPENPPEFREITWRLYGGDKQMRIRQEMLLGVGGYKALAALGCRPQVCHMNEGHAAFMSMARLEEMVNEGVDPNVALEVVWRSNIFTTHTPVPAGNEVFDINLARPYLAALAERAHMDVDRIIRWGIPINERNTASEMSMTVLGLRLANYSNGVSRLHGEVAREMWKHLWPQRSASEIPIGHITNGVHVPSWISPRLRMVFDRYLPRNWMYHPDREALAQAVHNIPDEELWMVHERCRQSMIRKARKISARSAGTAFHVAAEHKNILDPDILTIGFARRFATYKRGTLLLRNPERLVALLKNKTRPVQFVFAGKAHPADEGGKKLIQDLILFARQHGVQDRLIFLEDYDIALARSLVQGVDVWLNNPRRPQEASGTSGMKAAINGVINFSILDGWWDEAYTPECGWAIFGNSKYTDYEDTDNFEAQSLLNVLEDEIIPCYYERTAGDLPTRWITKMKECIIMSLGMFSSARMVSEYNDMFYLPAAEAYRKLSEKNYAYARKLVEQKIRLVDHFRDMSIQNPVISRLLENVHVGDSFTLSAEVSFGAMTPEELDVEVYYGPVNIHNEVTSGNVKSMTRKKDLGNNRYLYECELECTHSGRFGLTARITPAGNAWDNSVPGFICWPDK